MDSNLKHRIVRDPVSSRIFMVEKDPSPKPAALTLRRLDREPRESAHVYRTRTEVLGMVFLEPSSRAHLDLLEAVRAFLMALYTLTNVEGTDPAICAAAGERLASLVDAQEAKGFFRG